MTRATVSADGETITVHIPLTFRKRGGRKLVVTPDGAEWAPRPRVDNAMVKALARAFRWRKMLDEGVHATLEDLARAKGVNATYVSRILRLTLLAPEIVEAILDGRQPAELQLDDLLEGFPLEWDRTAQIPFDQSTVECEPSELVSTWLRRHNRRAAEKVSFGQCPSYAVRYGRDRRAQGCAPRMSAVSIGQAQPRRVAILVAS